MCLKAMTTKLRWIPKENAGDKYRNWPSWLKPKLVRFGCSTNYDYAAIEAKWVQVGKFVEQQMRGE